MTSIRYSSTTDQTHHLFQHPLSQTTQISPIPSLKQSRQSVKEGQLQFYSHLQTNKSQPILQSINMSCYLYGCWYNCCASGGGCCSSGWCSYSYNSYYYSSYYNTCQYYNSGANAGTISGAVVGAIIGVIILIAIICYCYRKKQAERLQQQAAMNAMNNHDNGTTIIIPQQPTNPSYGQPMYNQPAYGQPAYGQPAYGQPAYGQPQYYGQQQGQQPIIITQ